MTTLMNPALHKIVFTAITVFIFSVCGCSDYHEQYYDDYDDFSAANQRNKGWFPDVITPITYDLHCNSYLDSRCAFGSYSYLYDAYVDSVYSDPGTEVVSFTDFALRVEKHNLRRPDWFLNVDPVPEGIFPCIRIDSFYITFDVINHKAYYVFSGYSPD